MNNKNFRIRNCVSLLLALIAIVTLSFACKAAGADITDEGDTNNDLTVTIDANGGSGGASSKKVSKGGMLAALTGDDLPKRTDYEIAYWSTVHDSYKDIFNFGSTPVNSNITIYPHWRMTLDAVSKLMEGNWLVYYTPENSTTENNLKQIYRYQAQNSYTAICYADAGENNNGLPGYANSFPYDLTTNFPSDLTPNTKAQTIVSIPLFTLFDKTSTLLDYNTSNAHVNIVNITGTNYNVIYSSYTQDFGIYIGDNSQNDTFLCNYGMSYKYILKDYTSQDLETINISQIGKNISKDGIAIKLNSYSANQFSYTISGSNATVDNAKNGTYRMIRIK